MPTTRSQAKKVMPGENPLELQATTTMENNFKLTFDALLQNLHNFEGKKEQDIEFFLEQFEQMAQATNLTESFKIIILKAKLAGHAKQILINSPELREETNFENLKNKLKEIFKIKKSFAEAQQKFSSISQLPSQTVDDFAKQFNITAQKYLSMSGHAKKDGAKALLDTIKLTKFVEALRPDISFEVQKTGPECFEDALKQAQKIEIALNNNKREINNVTAGSNSTAFEALLDFANSQTTELQQIKQEINNLKLQTDKKPTTNNRETLPQNNLEKYCHICSKKNHMTDQCSFNLKNKGNNQRNFTPRPRFQHNNQNFRPRNSQNYWPQFRQRNYFAMPQYGNSMPGAHQNYLQGWGYNNQVQQSYGNNTQIPNQPIFPNTNAVQPSVTFPQEYQQINATANPSLPNSSNTNLN